MSREVNGKPIRERGGNKKRPSRKDFRPAESRSVTETWTEQAPYFSYSEDETPQTHVVARRPYLETTHAEDRVTIETRTVPTRQLLRPDDKKAPANLRIGITTAPTRSEMPGYGPLIAPLPTGHTKRITHRTQGQMVRTTDQKVAWKSPISLLRHNKPDLFEGKAATFTRVTSITKQPITEREEPLPEGLSDRMMVETVTEIDTSLDHMFDTPEPEKKP